MDSHDREILFKEKYASSSHEIYYAKPSDQSKVVILEDVKRNNIVGILTKVLLPQGYPHSVSKDYIAYQIWDTAQAFCSTIMGILATQAVLQGVGVGNKTATPLAATITWVLKDGCGHLGRILFAYSHGSSLDSYSKKWRLFADTMNDAAMCIEIALPLFHNYTTFALCISTIMKSIVGVAGGATRVAMTQHHAIRGNMGDVSAKDSAQETAVNLVASITALLIITLLGKSLFIFIVMMILHIVFNYLAVRAVCLRTLNEPRFLQVIDSYLRNAVIATPCAINRSEPIIFYQIGSNLLDLKMCGFEIKLGQSLAHVIQYSPEASYLKKIKELYHENQYIVLPNSNKRRIYVFLKQHASVDDVLRAYFHAVLLATIIRAFTSDSIGAEAIEPSPFAHVCRMLQQEEFARPEGHCTCLYKPPFELLNYVCNFMAKEWPIVRMGLLRTGWDLSKHLIMVDEWRLTNDSKSETIDPDNTMGAEDNRSSENFVSCYSTPENQRWGVDNPNFTIGSNKIFRGWLSSSKKIPENTVTSDLISAREIPEPHVFTTPASSSFLSDSFPLSPLNANDTHDWLSTSETNLDESKSRSSDED